MDTMRTNAPIAPLLSLARSFDYLCGPLLFHAESASAQDDQLVTQERADQF
jgi:hypothetical protein